MLTYNLSKMNILRTKLAPILADQMKSGGNLAVVESLFWNAVNTVLLDTKDIPVNNAIINELSEIESEQYATINQKVTALTTKLNTYAYKTETVIKKKSSSEFNIEEQVKAFKPDTENKELQEIID